jgi:cytochrome c553
MRRFICLVVLGAASLFATGALRAAGDPPAWAYAIPAGAPAPGAPPAAPAAPATPAAPDMTMKQVPGSTLSFPQSQIANGFAPADWFPGDHPPMPDIVAHGKQPTVRACGLCHMPNGKGRQENAGVAGLPVSYFIQQINDFRNDLRKSAEPRKGNTNAMIAIAKGMTPEEIKQAAEYFGSMKWTPWIRVVETKTVPKMESEGGIWVPAKESRMEPIVVRIIETPENVERTTRLRDPRSGFIAYVPVGSVKKGETLVMTGGSGKTTACGVCHGADLLGVGPVPGIAGRSPSYLVRQLYDMQAGARHGEWTQLMKPVVAKLTDEDFVNIAAYVSGRMPPATVASTR